MVYNALALTIIRRPWTVILSGMLVVAVVSSVAVFQVRKKQRRAPASFLRVVNDGRPRDDQVQVWAS